MDTRIYSQYVDFNREYRHFIIEHDKKWISFFNNSFALSENSKIITLNQKDLQFIELERVKQYENFSENFLERNLISIDDPIGSAVGS